ncbi:serine/threonine protein kinase [Streptomyces sp. ISL-96]|uniref:serine/threonine-protein kinase n=1 Tax=Streptomyces sp. ISL-96 TaxID=2819191 RepID=UPI001BE78722|nr:serine/threonine protein kinase [Streptomyces sp. ISL-96]
MLVADRYRLDTPIGRGGMGEVWRATDEVLGRPVAVKLLLGNGADASAAARFRLEAQTAARLSHPHLVAVFDFGAWEDRFYLVMELVEGTSLAQTLVSEGALRAERVANIAAQAAAGLAAAHRQGVVHRDIKPGNLMTSHDGTVKIADFGIAQFVDDPATALTTAGQIVGTSLYLAPERALGRPAGPASDMYSLGCVLYQLLAGRPPFQADTATGTLYQHVDAAPVPPRNLGVDVPAPFEAYLLGLLAKQPEDRPTAEQAADWFRRDSWRGHSQPLPPAPPANGAPPQAPTTYSLPSTGTTRPASRRRAAPPVQRPSTRVFVRRRPRVASAIAGAIAFVAAVLIGMAWLSPNPGNAETPEPSPGTTAESPE